MSQKLSLWDASGGRIAEIIAGFNRCVIFETNEVSCHGHPIPVQDDQVRRSLASYYYTQDQNGEATPHNTLYLNIGHWWIASATWCWFQTCLEKDRPSINEVELANRFTLAFDQTGHG